MMRCGLYTVDFGISFGSTAAMGLLRTILALVMIVAILPWGAFTAPFPTPAKPAAEVSITSLVAAVAEPEVRFFKAAKRCKGPSLPGSPCGPQTIISGPASVVFSPPRVTGVRFARADTRLNGTFDETALDPPILG